MSGAQTIAVAVDGSEASAAALASAVRAAREQRCSLLGVFVLDTGWVDFIGNDWQSAAGARQGFLDYVREALEAQAKAAGEQFAAATAGLPDARFEVMHGDPLETLVSFVDTSGAQSFFMGRETFRVCGRPSIERLPEELAQRIPCLTLV